MIPSLYNSLVKEGIDFTNQEPPKSNPAPVSKDPNVVSTQQEEDDIAKGGLKSRLDLIFNERVILSKYRHL